MFIFFIVVWILTIYCIFRNVEIEKENEIKIIDQNYDPVDDPEYMKKNLELNLRDIINNQVLDNEFNKVETENKKDN
jgi:hypothetical protein